MTVTYRFPATFRSESIPTPKNYHSVKVKAEQDKNGRPQMVVTFAVIGKVEVVDSVFCCALPYHPNPGYGFDNIGSARFSRFVFSVYITTLDVNSLRQSHERTRPTPD